MTSMLGLLLGIAIVAVPPYTKPTNIAHRGASAEAPEHTIAAYQLALKYQADFIEPDLQLTKDGILICMHDITLERTTNVEEVYPDRFQMMNNRKTWPISNFTWEEIQKLDAGSWKGEKFKGEKVPSFQQMIDLVKGKAGIIPETKSPEVYGKLGLNMEKALIEILEKNQLLDSKSTPVIIQSFSAESLKILKQKYQCKLPLVYLFSNPNLATVESLKAIQMYADGIAPNKVLVTELPIIVERAHKLGMSVTIWTCRTGYTGKFKTVKEEMRYFLEELKVDAIFTDNPDQFPR